MTATLTIVRYPLRFSYFGFLSMAVFPVFLFRNKSIFFYKLMGSGKNGTFDVKPDLQQWALLAVHKNELPPGASSELLFGKKIAGWWKWFRCETMTIALEPTEGHGKWNRKECFGKLPLQSAYDGRLAVLTRASIRISKARSFWKNVTDAASDVRIAEGYITSFGIGELPWIKQVTFSVWANKDAMKNYAYKTKSHQQVMHKAKQENWFSEEMFVRFRILWTTGMLNGKNEIKECLEAEEINQQAGY